MGLISDLMAQGQGDAPAAPRTYTQLTSDPGFLGASYEDRRRQYADWLKTDAPQLLQNVSDKQKHQFVSEINQRFAQDVPRPASGGVFGNDLFNRTTIGLNEGIGQFADAVSPGSEYAKAIRAENDRIRASMSAASQDEDLALQERLAKADQANPNAPGWERAKVYGRAFLSHPLDTMAGVGGSSIPALLGGAVAAPLGIAAGAAQAFGGSRGAEYDLAQTMPLDALRRNPDAAAMLDAGVPEAQVRDTLGRQIGAGNVIAGAGGAISGSFLGRVAGGRLGQGITQALESGWRAPVAGAVEQGIAGGVTQLGTNIAAQQVQPDVSTGRDIFAAAAQGALPGAVFGGVGALRSREAPAATPTEEAPPSAPAPQLGYDPNVASGSPVVTFPDGSVSLASQAGATSQAVGETLAQRQQAREMTDAQTALQQRHADIAAATTRRDATQADLENLTSMYQGTAEQPVQPVTQEEAYAAMAPRRAEAPRTFIDPDEFGAHIDALDAQRQTGRDAYEAWWTERLNQLDAQPWRQDLRPDESAAANYQAWWHDEMMNNDTAQQAEARTRREAAEAEETRNALMDAVSDEQYNAIQQRIDQARAESLRGVVDRVAGRAVNDALADPSSRQSAAERFNALLDAEMSNYPHSRAQLTPELLEQGQRLAGERLEHAQGLLHDTAQYLHAIPDMSAQETAAWINDVIPERRTVNENQQPRTGTQREPGTPARTSRATRAERGQAATRDFAFGHTAESRREPAETDGDGHRAGRDRQTRAESADTTPVATAAQTDGEHDRPAAPAPPVQPLGADTGNARTPAAGAANRRTRWPAAAHQPDTGPGAAITAAPGARRSARQRGAADTAAAGPAGGEPALAARPADAGERAAIASSTSPSTATGTEASHAIQEPRTDRQMLRGERPEVGLPQVGEGNARPEKPAGEGAAGARESPTAKENYTRHEALTRVMSELTSIENPHTRTRERTYFRDQIENLADPQTGRVTGDDVQKLADEARQRLGDQRLWVKANRKVPDHMDVSKDEAQITDERAAPANDNVNRLAPEDKALLQDAAAAHGVRSPAKFAMIAKLNSEFPGSFWHDLSAKVRSLVNTVMKGVGVLAAAIAINHAVPMHDARAQVAHADVTVSRHTKGLEGRNDIVNQWVQKSGDNNGGSYLIADKENGNLYVMSPKGEVRETIPALFGAAKGDEAVQGQTPAGAFTLNWQKAPDTKTYGDSIQTFRATDKGTFAIHRVLTGTPEHRAERLASGNPADRRITNGCINVPAEAYNRLFDKNYNGRLYVVPDNAEELGRRFPGGQPAGKTSMLQRGLKAGAEAALDALVPSANASTGAPADSGGGMGMLAALGAGYGASRLLKRRAAARAEADTALRADMQREAAYRPEPAASQSAAPSFLADTVAKAASILSRDENPIPRTHDEAMNLLRGEPVREPKPASADTLSYQLWRNLREGLNFTDTPFLSWARQSLRRDGGEYDSIPAYRAWRLMKGKARAEYHDMLHDQGKRLMDLTNDIAQKHKGDGRDPAQVAREISYYPTYAHIAGSATDAVHASLKEGLDNAQARIDDVVKRGEVASPDMMRARDAARDDLAEFGHAQQHDGRTDAGETSRLLPGGATRAQAREAMRLLEQRYGKDDMQRLAAEHVKVHAELRRAGIDAGVYDRSLEDSPLNRDYVPLTGDPGISETGEHDVFGASAMNHDLLRTRGGRASLADDALTAFHARASELSRAIAKQPFVEALTKAIRDEKPAGVHVVPDSQPVGQRDVIRFRDEEGNRQKIYWDDHSVGQALRAGLNDAHSEVLQKIGAATRGYFQLITRFTPMFAPINRMKDVLERSFNAASRNILTAEGKPISRTRFFSDVARRQASPQMNGAVLNFLRGAPDTSKFGQYLKELHEGGALMTYTNEYAKSRESIIREAARARDIFNSKDVKESALTLRDVALGYVNKWNEFFDTGSSLSIYAALRDQGVPKQEAQFRTLDLFDLNQRGKATGWARAFLPFANSTFKGGGNFVRSMSTRRGQALFATAFVGGLMMYSMAHSMANDDPDTGNEVDNLPESTIANGIPVKVGDHFLSVPVGFGIPKVAWEMAVLASRAAAGKSDMSDVVFGAANAVLRETTPLSLPEGSSGSLLKDAFMTATPGLLRPAAQVALNTSQFGSPIVRDLSPEQYRSMQGTMNTEESYKRLANGVRETTGLDLAPEEWKTLVNGYLIGPLTGVASLFQEPGAKGKLQTTREELGLWDAFGLSRLVKGNPRELESQFYSELDRAQRQQRAGAAGDEDVDPARVDATTRAVNALRTLSQQAKQAYKDANGDVELIRPELEAIEAQRGQIMRGYLRETQ
ncbi:hypothetical protein P3T23_004515 [Paraburkholderia sp. GAS448]|uniref:LPD38 domain-containing protein n=1 Tax=Paraburkholderia sp. GAS448 TaxID=3035136 RepID=UPI003D1DD878